MRSSSESSFSEQSEQSEVELDSASFSLEREGTDKTYLVNRCSGKYHLPFSNALGVADPFKAKCGWRYQEHESSIATTLPTSDPSIICGVCLPAHRRACKSGQDSRLATLASHCASSSSDSS